jgi:Sulfotransferase domain
MTVDFLVIGAPKSGTTSLFEHLRGHPEIDLPPDKEVAYFSDDRIYKQAGWDEYLRKWAFRAPKRGRVSGTITPHYMTSIAGVAADAGAETVYDNHTLPARIHKQLPSARLIAILRDPVERAHSHHAMTLRSGVEQRPFATAVDELLQPEALAHSRSQSTEINGYVVDGEYGRLLDGYYSVFPREQILVLFTDDLAREPLDVLRRIYDFLEVSPDYEPPNLGKRYNVAGAEFKLSPTLPRRLVKTASANPVARAAWRSLSPARQTAVHSAFRRATFRFANWNRRGETSASEPSTEVVDALGRLRDHYTDDEPKLEKLLGYPPPWVIAGGASPPGASGRATVDREAVRK